MSLPPILSNLPVFRLFKSDHDQDKDVKKTAETASPAQLPQDVVDLSKAAQARLEGMKPLETEAQASQTAHETGVLLQKSDLPLGLDQWFDTP